MHHLSQLIQKVGIANAKRFLPYCVLKVISKLLFLSSRMCQSWWARLKCFEFASSCKTSSIFLLYHRLLFISLFISLGSRHNLKELPGFFKGTIIIELIHSVYSRTSLITPSSTSLFNSLNSLCSLLPDKEDVGQVCNLALPLTEYQS